MKRRVRFGLPLGLVCALLGRFAAADGFIVIHDPPPHIHIVPRPPHPPRPHYPFAPLEVRYHHVNTKITEQVAVTEVDQVFYNPNNQQLEGTYLFPIPKGAKLDKFSMDINGKSVEAELLDANKARQLYEDIVRKMKDPALLEYADQDLFKVRIFPIEPRSEKRIQLKYTQLLRSDGGMVEYVYPLNTEKFSAAPIKTVSLKIELDCQRSLKSIYSPSHPVEIKRHGDKQAVIGYETRDAKPETDFQLFFSTAPDDVGLSVLTYNDGWDSEGGYFMLLASPSAKLAGEQIAKKDVVFVFDTSGSMAKDNKIEQARRALRFCLKNLNDGDRFEIVRFSTETQPLFEKLADVNRENIAKAEQFVDQFKPIGGTAIEDALLKALEPAKTQGDRDRPYFVVFLTDGKPTIGNPMEDHIVGQVVKAIGDRTIRVFCFGVGTDINTHLLDKLAEKTQAASQYVLPEEDIEIKVSNFYEKINQPVLANLNLKFSGAIRSAKLHPGRLPDLFRGEQLVVFGRYTGDGDAAITLEGTVNGRTRSFVHEAAFPRRATQHEFVPRLWATRRVGFLLDEMRLHGQNSELREEITQLARKYGIVTPFTAYLILEDESRRDVPVAQRSLREPAAESGGGGRGIAGLPLRSAGGRMFKESQETKDGDIGVGSARAFDELKRAETPAASAKANNAIQRGQRGAYADEGEKVQQALEAQQPRYVRGRAFYQNGEQWVDAHVASRQDARRVQLKFNSDEYFALLKKRPDAAPWLALGRNVQVLLDDTVYEIVE